ncbi:MAG TPA: protein kinase [Bacteroidota bacterium]|nr:protein kinase [Bacteroidota bacterium]
MIGTTISHYKILEKLGEGGMGVGYKAQDTKLDRTVALKFLPEHVSVGSADLERFTQEAKAAAGLNHPNICTIYGIEEADNKNFIVMEFVDGQMLQEKKSSLSMKQALDIGIQIAEGLAAAHEKGIVHRDIKPENIMIRKDGRVQIMDFGLAKLRGASRLTKEGSTVGTAGYMSPEQVQGQETDHRSDVFSLGVLLYEMLTGQPPFKGVHETAITYEIVNVDSPPMSSIKTDISPELDAIVLECLEKDPAERTQSAGQVALVLKRARRESSKSRVSRIRPVEGALPGASQSEPKWNVIIGVAAAAILFGIGMGWLLFRGPEQSHPLVMRFSIPYQSPTSGLEDGFGGFSLSPDGSQLVFGSQRDGRLFIREMGDTAARIISGVGDADYSSLAFSPDGQWLLFGSRGKLMKHSVKGGTPVEICDLNRGYMDGSWTEKGDILFTPEWGSNIMVVSAEGGSIPRQLTTLRTDQGERAHLLPRPIPGSNAAFFTIWTGASFEDALIAIVDLSTGDHHVLLRGGSDARYVSSGHIVFVRGSTLMAVPFEVSSLQIRGDPVPVMDGVLADGTGGPASISISNNGTLAYISGEMDFLPTDITIIGLGDKRKRIVSAASNRGAPLFSPDGSKLCVEIYGPVFHMGVHDLRQNILTQLTFKADNYRAAWLRDGSRISFSSNEIGRYQISSVAADGRGTIQTLTDQPGNPYPSSWSAGNILAYGITNKQTGQDIWLYDAKAETKTRPFLQTPATETAPKISPDDRWIAYTSEESGKPEIYVQPFPSGEGKWRLSNGGGQNPCWGPDGRRVYFEREDEIFVVPIRVEQGESLSPGREELVYTAPGLNRFDVSPDGRSLVIDQRIIRPGQRELKIVLNWFEELKKKVPVD